MNDQVRLKTPAGAPLAHHPACNRRFPTLCEACLAEVLTHQVLPTAPPLIYPPSITKELRFILGLMLHQSIPLAHIYRAAGHDIARKVETEQAFVFDRAIRIALGHGEKWMDVFLADVNAARNTATSLKTESTQ